MIIIIIISVFKGAISQCSWLKAPPNGSNTNQWKRWPCIIGVTLAGAFCQLRNLMRLFIEVDLRPRLRPVTQAQVCYTLLVLSLSWRVFHVRGAGRRQQQPFNMSQSDLLLSSRDQVGKCWHLPFARICFRNLAISRQLTKGSGCFLLRSWWECVYLYMVNSKQVNSQADEL